MSLLSLVQDVCDEVGLPRPNAVAASSDQLARQMYSLARAELTELSKRFEWPILQKEHTFNTVAGVSAYALPADYRKLVGHSIYNAAAYYQLRGSVSPQEWQHTRNLNLATLSRARVRISGNPLQLRILPTPNAVEAVVYEYAVRNFAVNAAGAPQANYAVDGDVAIIDEALVKLGLKWRIKHAKGLEFGVDLTEYNAVAAREFSASLGSPVIQIGGRPLSDSSELTNGYVPQNGFGV